MTSELTASVVIPCYTEERWSDTCNAVQSALTQDPAPEAVIVAVDRNVQLFRRLQEAALPIKVVLNQRQPGSSATRNTGASVVTSPIIAFLDDDAIARPGWLANLVEPFRNDDVVGTGGSVAPKWGSLEPRWFPPEFAWTVGASFRGQPTQRSQVRNVWSENMAVRRCVFDAVGRFNPDFTKVGSFSRPDDTDLCVRMGKATRNAAWIYVPEAVVDHVVGPERTRLAFFLRRCYLEGRGKVELAHRNDGVRDLGSEQHYLRRTVPEGILNHLRHWISRSDVDGAARAGTMVLGTAAAGCGALDAATRLLCGSLAFRQVTSKQHVPALDSSWMLESGPCYDFSYATRDQDLAV